MCLVYGVPSSHVILQNLSDEEQRGLRIYESIPKEMVKSASDLDFSIQPQIIEDDPLVLWDVGDLTPARDNSIDLRFAVKTRSQEERALDFEDYKKTLDSCKVEDGGLSASEKYELEEAAREKISERWGWDMKDVHKICLQYWKRKHMLEQLRLEKELQAKVDPVTEVVEPGSPTHEEVKERAKEELEGEALDDRIEGLQVAGADDATGIVGQFNEVRQDGIRLLGKAMKNIMGEGTEEKETEPITHVRLDVDYLPEEINKYWPRTNVKEVKPSESACKKVLPSKVVAAVYEMDPAYGNTPGNKLSLKVHAAMIHLYDSVADAQKAGAACGYDLIGFKPIKGYGNSFCWIDYNISGFMVPEGYVCRFENFVIRISNGELGWNQLTAIDGIMPVFAERIEKQAVKN